MRTRVFVMVAVMFLVWSVWPLVAVQAQGQSSDAELKKFQGTWVMVSGELGGKKTANEDVSRSKIVYEGNKMQIVDPKQTPETIIAEIVMIDPTKTPKEMHLIRKNGPNAGKVLIGIYEFEGDDQYKFALDPTGAMTLKEFVTEEGRGHVRNTWKRVKP
jgi:uncharacterized protein (TIGR03067 family)